MFKNKNKLIFRKKKSCHTYCCHSIDGVQDGVKVASAPVVRWGKTVVPTYSNTITTGIIVKFSLVTDLWVAWLLDHSVVTIISTASCMASKECERKNIALPDVQHHRAFMGRFAQEQNHFPPRFFCPWTTFRDSLKVSLPKKTTKKSKNCVKFRRLFQTSKRLWPRQKTACNKELLFLTDSVTHGLSSTLHSHRG
jgi:hypothetical protein